MVGGHISTVLTGPYTGGLEADRHAGLLLPLWDTAIGKIFNRMDPGPWIGECLGRLVVGDGDADVVLLQGLLLRGSPAPHPSPASVPHAPPHNATTDNSITVPDAIPTPPTLTPPQGDGHEGTSRLTHSQPTCGKPPAGLQPTARLFPPPTTPYNTSPLCPITRSLCLSQDQGDHHEGSRETAMRDQGDGHEGSGRPP